MVISVVIGTRDRAPLLRITLEHLRLQQYGAGDEVIVVDNASTDDTPGVIRDAAATFPVPLRYLRETMPGKSAAVNAGVRIARGEILALTDDDVWPASDWITAIRATFSDRSLAVAGGRVDPWWETPCPWWLRPCEPDMPYGVMFSPLALLHYGPAQPLGERGAVGANLIVRREVFEDLGGFAQHLGRHQGTLLCGEDHEFCERAVAAGYRLEYRPELRVRHWVSAHRLRLRYYVRWFFWSGITNAMIDMSSFRSRPAVRHMTGRLAVELWKAFTATLSGRPADGVAHGMEAAFAIGYLCAGMKVWPRRQIRTARQPVNQQRPAGVT